MLVLELEMQTSFDSLDSCDFLTLSIFFLKNKKNMFRFLKPREKEKWIIVLGNRIYNRVQHQYELQTLSA